MIHSTFGIRPATPLPWSEAKHGFQMRGLYGPDHQEFAFFHASDYRNDHGNAAYIVQACNAYIKLVAALISCIEDAEEHFMPDSEPQHIADARALLRAIGEIA